MMRTLIPASGRSSGFLLRNSFSTVASTSTSSSSSPKSYESIPGPIPAGPMGNLQDFQNRMTKFKGSYRFVGQSYYQEYGELVKVEIGEPGLWIYHPDDMLETLRQEGAYPTSSVIEAWPAPAYFDRNKRPHIFGVGPEWQRLRRAVQKDMFNPAAAESYLPILDEPAREASKMLGKFKGTIRDFTPNVATDLFFTLMLGHNPKSILLHDPQRKHEVDPEDVKFIRNSMKALEDIAALTRDHTARGNMEKHAGVLAFFKLMDEIADRSKFYVQRAAQMGQKGDSEEVTPYIFRLMARHEIDPKEAVDVLSTFFFAGVDTTHHVLLWLFYHLAKNPDKQEKIYQEISTKLQEEGKGDAITSEHVRLPYLNACIREAHRLTPAIPVLTTRRFDKPITVRGITIPANTPTQLHTFPIQNDPKYVDQVDSFIPERWFPEEVKKRQGTEKEILDHKLLTKPFGFGARMCIGSRVAESEYKSFLLRVVLDWKFKFDEKNPNVQFFEKGMAGVTANLQFEPRK